MLVVSLLLTDRLRVKNILLERNGEYLISLTGEFVALGTPPPKEVRELARIIDRNPNLNISGVINLITKKGMG